MGACTHTQGESPPCRRRQRTALGWGRATRQGGFYEGREPGVSRAVKPVKCGGWPREAATQSPSRYVLHQLLKPQSARGRSVRLAEIPPCVSAHTHIITARAHGPKPAHCGRLKRLPHRIGRKKSQSVALSSRSRRSLVALTSHEIRTPTALPHTGPRAYSPGTPHVTARFRGCTHTYDIGYILNV